MAFEEGGQLAGVDQVERRALALFLDPGEPRLVEGVGEDAEGFAVQLQQHELALDRQGQGHPVEGRGAAAEGIESQHRIMQGGPQAAGEGLRRKIGQLVEGIHQAMPQFDRAIARGAHQLGIEALQRRYCGVGVAVHRYPSRGLGEPDMPESALGWTYARIVPAVFDPGGGAKSLISNGDTSPGDGGSPKNGGLAEVGRWPSPEVGMTIRGPQEGSS
ncbi:hypothetical protein D9M71_593820 [compost metagenome]